MFTIDSFDEDFIKKIIHTVIKEQVTRNDGEKQNKGEKMYGR